MSKINRTIAYGTGGVLAGLVGVAVIVASQEPGEPAVTDSVAKPPAAEVITTEETFQTAAAAQEQTTPITHDSDALTFSARFPQHPEMRLVTAALRAEASDYLDRARREARDDEAANQQWEVNIAWTTIATAGGYASMLGRSYEYRGGAHPIQLVDTRLMSLQDGQEIALADFFLSRAWPTPAVAIAVCEELKKAKTRSVGAPTVFDEPIICAGPRNNLKMDEARLAFAASRSSSGFGGLHVLYQPYAVGSYAEGGYELTIPADVFREDLRKEYQGLFSGDPAPLEN